jgi:hypothetical protein
MEYMKFRKKPVVIEAVQFTGYNSTELEAWFIGHDARKSFGVKDGGRIVLINTLEGTMEATPNDWIIRGVKGEFYPCKPDIFKATYDPVE